MFYNAQSEDNKWWTLFPTGLYINSLGILLLLLSKLQEYILHIWNNKNQIRIQTWTDPLSDECCTLDRHRLKKTKLVDLIFVLFSHNDSAHSFKGLNSENIHCWVTKIYKMINSREKRFWIFDECHDSFL